MLGWIYRLLIGRFVSCNHEWEIESSHDRLDIKDNYVLGRAYFARCKKCGIPKRFNV